MRLVRQRIEILAVAGLAAAIGNGVALGLVLRARWFLEFFSSWEVPVAVLCISFVLVGLCFWISTRAEGIYEGLAIAGVAVSAMTSVVLIVLAVLAGLVWLIVCVLEDEKTGRRLQQQMKRPGRRFNLKQGSGSRKQKQRRQK